MPEQLLERLYVAGMEREVVRRECRTERVNVGTDTGAGGYALDEPPDHPVVTLVRALEVALRWDKIVLDRARVDRLVEQCIPPDRR
jgi:hypothetical protein